MKVSTEPAAHTSQSAPAGSRETREVRIQVPRDDADVMAFLDAQPERGLSRAIRQVIKMYVAEFGTADPGDAMAAKLAALYRERDGGS